MLMKTSFSMRLRKPKPDELRDWPLLLLEEWVPEREVRVLGRVQPVLLKELELLVECRCEDDLRPEP